ncbi:MAG: hypothetical protein P9M03_04470 [Candidatus Theseobacter exili]|nr:hypothetical protein [Candidatus Theseobacter exili]
MIIPKIIVRGGARRNTDHEEERLSDVKAARDFIGKTCFGICAFGRFYKI